MGLAHARGGLGGAFGFKGAADEEGFLDLLGIDARRAGARLGHHLDQVFIAEFLHRLAHRGA